MIAPGGTIGILGGGQLGRMLALAAAPLGYRCHIFSPEPGGPAAQGRGRRDCGGLRRPRGAGCLQRGGGRGHGRVRERAGGGAGTARGRCAGAAGRGLAPRRPEPHYGKGFRARPRSRDDALRASRGTTGAPRPPTGSSAGPPSSRPQTLGYDGKGQVVLAADDDLVGAWRGTLRAQPAILEALAPIEREVSVVAARGADGQVASFDPVENRHVNGILDVDARASGRFSRPRRGCPRRRPRASSTRWSTWACCASSCSSPWTAAFWSTRSRPRVHNSGHWTIEGCETSQFAQHVRAVCGLPLGSSARRANAAMKNLVGADVEHWRALAANPAAHLHLYGKAETRPGRKMGHVHPGSAPSTPRRLSPTGRPRRQRANGCVSERRSCRKGCARRG